MIFQNHLEANDALKLKIEQTYWNQFDVQKYQLAALGSATFLRFFYKNIF